MARKISRRDVFRMIAGTGALVPLSYVAGVSLGGYAARQGLKTLTDKQAAVLESVAEVIIPDGNALGLSVRDIQLVQQLDDYIGGMPWYSRHKVEMLILAIEHVFPVRCLYFRKFTKLSYEHRRAILEKLNAGSNGERALVRAIKALIQSVYYNDPRVAERIGFEGKC